MKGQLAQHPFGELLKDLYITAANGILTISRDKQTKAIFVEEGQAVFALSNAPQDQLGEMLVIEGWLTPEQLTSLSTGTNIQQLAQKIAESGFISVEELDKVIQQLTINAIVSIFGWPDAAFTFEKGAFSHHNDR